MSKQLGRFEDIVERLVEGSLSRLFAGELQVQDVLSSIARAIEDNSQDQMAPDRYWVYLNPADWARIVQTTPEFGTELERQILSLTRQAGLDLAAKPVVEVLSLEDVPRHQVSVTASVTRLLEEKTQAMDAAHVREQINQPPDGQTYLIVDGTRHVSLTRPVYTIGRRLDCDIVLSDPRVSRRHAQLRWRFGRYVLYDLGSSTGTSVNGEPVAEVVLEPGDVFSLGGVDVIYGRERQDEKPQADGDTTRSWRVRRDPADGPMDPL